MASECPPCRDVDVGPREANKQPRNGLSSPHPLPFSRFRNRPERRMHGTDGIRKCGLLPYSSMQGKTKLLRRLLFLTVLLVLVLQAVMPIIIITITTVPSPGLASTFVSLRLRPPQIRSTRDSNFHSTMSSTNRRDDGMPIRGPWEADAAEMYMWPMGYQGSAMDGSGHDLRSPFCVPHRRLGRPWELRESIW